jgi:tetratricopeptide (TPR) repeat protein
MEQSLPETGVVSAAAARKALTDGAAADALDIAVKGIRKNPLDTRFLAVAADACLRLGKTTDRVEYLRSMTMLRPDDVRSWAKLATAIREISNSGEAANEVLRGYKKHPSEPMRALLSDIYRKSGQFDKAMELWPDRQDPAHVRMVSDLLLEDRKYERADSSYAEVLRLRPNDLEALKGQARVSQNTRDWPKAIERWRLVTLSAPHDPSSMMQLASVLRIAGHLHRAEETIQTAMAMTEAAMPAKFWGLTGSPHPDALNRSLPDRIASALDSQARHLVGAGSPYNPSVPSPFDDVLNQEWEGKASSVLQYKSEAKFLARFLEAHGIKSFFEVGMRHGSFTKLLDKMLNFERVGGSEFLVTPKLKKLLEDKRFGIFAGDHHSNEYQNWRLSQKPFDFVFIDGGHSFNDVTRDFIREKRFRPRYIGFHDVWNIACLGAKRMWDEIPGKLVYYCNTNPNEYLFIANRARNFETNYLDLQRQSNGYCCGIGIIETGN